MSRYLFIFGTTPQLSRAELTQVLKRFSYSYVELEKNENTLLVESEADWDTKILQKWLGGTVKIGRIIDSNVTGEIEQLQKTCAKHLKNVKQFGISFYGFGNSRILKDFVGVIKNDYLPESRYKLPQEGIALTAAFHKQELTELAIAKISSEIHFVARIETVQNIDDWTHRDRGRPHADAKSGMLPLKIARMMVNMALDHQNNIVADPFCGMGSILSEALMVGADVIGSDTNKAAVSKTDGNLNWLKTQYSELIERSIALHECDATHISEKISPHSLDAIVTEPFLGAPFERRGSSFVQKGKPVTAESVANTIRGLEKLYLGALKNWRTLLKKNARVVIIAPSIEWQSKNYSVKKVFDNCEMLGYTLDIGPIEYARPHAIVKRHIYVLTTKEQ